MSDSIFTLIGRQTRSLVGEKLDITGGTLQGPLILNADPSTTLGAATKGYVDNAIATLSLPDYARLDGADFTGDITGTNLTLSGNLTVNGSVSALETSNSTIADSIILLSKGTGNQGSASNDSGFLIERGNSEANVAVFWDEGLDTFRFVSTPLGADSTDLSSNVDTTEADIAVRNIQTNGNDLGTIEEFYGGLVVSVGTISIPQAEWDNAEDGGLVSITGTDSPFASLSISTTASNPEELVYEIIENSTDGTTVTATLRTVSLPEGALTEFRADGTITFTEIGNVDATPQVISFL